jgi:FAD/FMN-containing dehydrogenase
VTLAELLEFAVPRGWFPPVTPGTKFVSIGGAIANDVHGKNHHLGGTFGRFVRRMELLRSDGTRISCSPSENPDLFRATIGGLGLTGFILTAEVALKAIPSPFILMDSIKFRNLEEFFEISQGSTDRYEYTVSWLDCVSTGTNFGRGIFMGGNHATEWPTGKRVKSCLKASLPIDVPGIFLGRPSMLLFNTLYYHKQQAREVRSTVSYEPFFYPLDAVHHWNRLYGRRGFFQFQCVVPKEGIRKVLGKIVQSGAGSFLAVLKEFGNVASPGLMSFPREGVTLALDFAHRGASTFALLADLDRMVREEGGRLYPAKDATMAPESFKAYYPQWETFAQHLDPKASSSFWRRVTAR